MTSLRSTLPTGLALGLTQLTLTGTLLAAPAPDPSDTAGADPFTRLQALGGALSFGGNVHADDHDGGGYDTGRVDGHAPLGVMGDHLHKEGEWMVSLRAMKMRMDGLRDGDDRVGAAAGYVVSPIDMDMRMVMLGAMYAASDDLTWMIMVPWVSNEMDHRVNPTGVRFTTRSEGLGDVRATALLHLAETEDTRVHLNLGLSAPTGSITQHDRTPASGGADVRLPFPMQLGTGTWDLLPGITLNGQREDHSWGAQVNGRLHLGNNSQGYRRGDRIEASAWYGHRFSESTSGSLRLAFADWDEVNDFDTDIPNGAPPAFPNGFAPMAEPDNQGGQRVDLLLGFNYLGARDTALAGHRFAFEVGAPLQQKLDGPGLETDWVLTLGWQKAF